MQKELEKIISYISSQDPKTKFEFDDARRIICNQLKINQPSNRFLLQAYQNLTQKKILKRDELLEQFLKKANIRNLSGIAVVTSLVKPYMCPGKCVYCPTEIRMPKSYIATEPAAARALRLNFSPYEQMKRRVEMLEANGHNCGKIEFIVKGGTWNAYPLAYQYWFILESFRACNNMKRRKQIAPMNEEDHKIKRSEDLIEALKKEQQYNETANHHIIGLTLETRPDAISPKTIWHMRQQGCTRVELGLQAPDDKLLEHTKRGHTVDQFRKAMYLLRCAGFKVDLHFMPQLPGTTPEHDVEMYKQIFDDPSLRPDMVKIYPCVVVKSAELYEWLKDGRYTPYSDAELFESLLQMKLATPRYCRISRLIRDIPETEIEAGNKVTNLREDLSRELVRRGQRCVCLRCREIGRQTLTLSPNHLITQSPKLFIDTYDTVGGMEYFLSFEDEERNSVYGFLRLRLPQYKEKTQEVRNLENLANLGNLKNLAIIRELHVYGDLVPIGSQNQRASQHKGLGKLLVAEAERIARERGYSKVAVISGVGVRGYYRKLGYRKAETYMMKQVLSPKSKVISQSEKSTQ